MWLSGSGRVTDSPEPGLTATTRIGQLGRTFNELADEVVRSHSTLEGEVADRTAKLEQSRRAALSLLQDATAQRKVAEASSAKLIESEKAVRARADWAQGLHAAGKDLIACQTIQEVVRVAALAPVAGLGAERAWVSAPGAGGRFEVIASSSPGLPGDTDASGCPSEGCLASGRHTTADTIGQPRDNRCRETAERDGFRSCGTWLCHARDGTCLCAVTVRFQEHGDESPVVAAAPLIDVFCRQVGIVWERILTEEDLRRLAERLGRATEAADAANKAKSAFLANMSHELRTPLGAIIGFSELLDERLFGELTPKQAEYVQDIIESGRHLLHLINDVLDLSKIEAGKSELELSTFPIAPLLTGSLVMVKEKCLKQGISLFTDVPESIQGLHITADERKLKQIMFNLLSNSANFSPRGASITVIARRNDDDVTISVVDTGIGVAKEHQQRIFDEFYQVERDQQGKAPGTGLGLSIVKRFVEMHGGVAWVESEGVGMGCAFRFTIPIRHTETTSGLNARPSVRDGDMNQRILIAEDDPKHQRLLADVLQAAGYDTLIAADGLRAVELARSSRPQLILMDLDMPELDGFAAVRILKRDPETQAIPVVAVTALAINGGPEHVLKAGFDGFVGKPIHPRDLRRVVSQYLTAATGNSISADGRPRLPS